MKVKELMQGDKVYETLLEDTPQVVTVEEVGQNHIYVGMEDDDFALLRYEPEHLGFNIKHIEPIPLTEEMLKANGFFQNTYNHLVLRIDDELAFCITQKQGRLWLPIYSYGKGMTLKYVHELQHALRLCRLFAFADNFKVTTKLNK